MSLSPEQGERMDLTPIRDRLRDSSGPRYWRSLEELAETQEFQEYLWREFPTQASEWNEGDGTSRRNFMRLMGASLALAGVTGCANQPLEEVASYVRMPENIVPGKPLYYATALPLDGYAVGVLVESHMGRPIKVEGNPDHPASLGATAAETQASILTMYDPDRSQLVLRNGRVSTWNELVGLLIDRRTQKLAAKGTGLRILTETVASPTLDRQIQALLKAMPEARWHVYEPAGRDTAAGTKLAFGQPLDAVLALDKANVIVSLGADFLNCGPDRLRSARQFGLRREPSGTDAAATVNRLYVAEPTPTITGAMADHRIPVSYGGVGALARLLAQRLGVEGATPPKNQEIAAAEWVTAVVEDLRGAGGKSVVLVGADQPAEVQAVVHAINQKLGNVGQTITFVPTVAAGADGTAGSLAELVADAKAGKVDTLLILGGNPVYSAPADVDVTGAIEKVEVTVRLGLYDDETSEFCDWQIPEAHPLEAWGDLRAFDGTVTLQQPLIAPLYGGKTAIDLLAVLNGEPNRPGLELVQETWRGDRGDGFDAFWKKALNDGVVPETAAATASVTPQSIGGIDWSKLEAAPAASDAIELVLRPDPHVGDGRHANNGWLQELPKPLTKLTWDNALMLSPRTASVLNVVSNDLVELTSGNRTLQVAVWVLPGQPDGTGTLHLGYGRRKAGRVGTGAGFNANVLRTTTAPWVLPRVTVRKTGGTYPLASTQLHWNIEPNATLGEELKGREILREATFADFLKDPKVFQHGEHGAEDLVMYPPPEPQRVREEGGEGNAWAMVINLNTCIGCNACVVACQAENNITVVGKDQVLRQREMHWLRIDTYFQGTAENPKTSFAPVPCMHCEKAPCEIVCPVAATTHSAEGLNEMTYNRCVGTRYCNNNCPYKVRRFNFLQYTDLTTPTLKMQRNPDVTVRTRGVMEKCTYCVQRINKARIDAERNGEKMVRSKDVETACQGACPTRAIVFGNLNDREGDLVKAKQNPRNYAMLASLNVRPRTTYLAKLTNPNPDLTPATGERAESTAE